MATELNSFVFNCCCVAAENYCSIRRHVRRAIGHIVEVMLNTSIQTKAIEMTIPGPALRLTRPGSDIIGFDVLYGDVARPVEMESDMQTESAKFNAEPFQLRRLSWTRRSGGRATTFEFGVLQNSSEADALSQFVIDLIERVDCIVVTDGLRTKAAVVQSALESHGLLYLAKKWNAVVNRGICLASPGIEVWLAHSNTVGNQIFNATDDLMHGDIEHNQQPPEFQGTWHSRYDVGEQRAEFLRIVALNMSVRLMPLCARGRAPHEFILQDLSGPRDNGERTHVCRNCGDIV